MSHFSGDPGPPSDSTGVSGAAQCTHLLSGLFLHKVYKYLQRTLIQINLSDVHVLVFGNRDYVFGVFFRSVLFRRGIMVSKIPDLEAHCTVPRASRYQWSQYVFFTFLIPKFCFAFFISFHHETSAKKSEFEF